MFVGDLKRHFRPLVCEDDLDICETLSGAEGDRLVEHVNAVVHHGFGGPAPEWSVDLNAARPEDAVDREGEVGRERGSAHPAIRALGRRRYELYLSRIRRQRWKRARSIEGNASGDYGARPELDDDARLFAAVNRR